MSNCYVNVVGGLGNQLFQIAAGYAYSKKYDKKLIINPNRWGAGQGNSPLFYKDTIFKNFEYCNYHTRDVIPIQEKRFNWDELPYYPGDVSLNGYFQSLKYFEDVYPEFIQMLNWKAHDMDRFLYKDGVYKPIVGLHIRRGDYLIHNKIHHVCDTSYFEHFIKMYQEKCNFIVFTDSPAHVIEEFENYELPIVIFNSDLQAFEYLCGCNIIVGSNSTFSWWASLISDQRCHFPSKWFADGREHQDIFREDMLLHNV